MKTQSVPEAGGPEPTMDGLVIWLVGSSGLVAAAAYLPLSTLGPLRSYLALEITELETPE